METWGFLGKLMAAFTLIGAAIVTPLWMAREWMERRLAEKADKSAVAEQFSEVVGELKHHRDVLTRLADQARENEQRSQDRHERLMERLKNGH